MKCPSLLTLTLLASCLATPSAGWSQSKSFSETLTECATSFNVRINQSFAEDLEDSVSGDAQLELGKFIEVFPDEDRLQAYRIFDECLSRRYRPVNGDQSKLRISEPSLIGPAVFPTLNNRQISFEETLDSISTVELNIPFSINARCSITLQFERSGTGNTLFDVSVRSGSKITGGYISNGGPANFILGPGEYTLRLYQRGSAAYVNGAVGARC